MPPLQALVALNGLWALALLPFAVWAVPKWPPLRLEVVGYALIAVGLVALAVLIHAPGVTVASDEAHNRGSCGFPAENGTEPLGTCISGRELLTWYPAVLPSQQKYIAQRILYVLGTNTDLPVMQVFLAGIALWFAARRRKRGVSLTEAEPRSSEGLLKEVAARAGD